MADPRVYDFDEEQEFFCTPQGEEMYHKDVVEALNGLAAVVKAGIAYKDTLAEFGREPEGIYHVGDESLLDDWTETIAALNNANKGR